VLLRLYCSIFNPAFGCHAPINRIVVLVKKLRPPAASSWRFVVQSGNPDCSCSAGNAASIQECVRLACWLHSMTTPSVRPSVRRSVCMSGTRFTDIGSLARRVRPATADGDHLQVKPNVAVVTKRPTGRAAVRPHGPHGCMRCHRTPRCALVMSITMLVGDITLRCSLICLHPSHEPTTS